MPYPEEASTAEMVNYTVQALWSYGYMKTFLFSLFIIIPRVTSTPYHHPDVTELYDFLLKRDKESKSSVKYSTEQHDPYYPLMFKIQVV